MFQMKGTDLIKTDIYSWQNGESSSEAFYSPYKILWKYWKWFGNETYEGTDLWLWLHFKVREQVRNGMSLCSCDVNISFWTMGTRVTINFVMILTSDLQDFAPQRLASAPKLI
jgi:hypothetical protein